MIPFRYQLLGHIVVALLLAGLLKLALAPSAPPPTTIERKATPFTTQSGMLAVTVAVHRDAPPQILEVQPLAQGRLSTATGGPYQLALEDSEGQPLFTLSFQVSFVVPGLHEETDEVRQIFVLPGGPEAARLSLRGPNGEAAYELSSNLSVD